MGSPIDVGGQYPFITFFTPPRLSGKFLLVAGHCLEGCVVVWQEMKSVSRKDQLCIVVRHDDFKAGDNHIELHAVKHYF